jgi:hypothetical protein
MKAVKLKCIDVSEYINPLNDSFPVCLICYNEISSYDPLCLVVANGSVGLAHKHCAEDIDSYLDKKGD